MKNRGTLFVLSAPSGAGKTTLARIVAKTVPGIQRSVSHTTRAPRPNETDGKDYHFISEKQFHLKIKGGDFIEWAEVFGNYYGTSFDNIDIVDQEKKDLLLDIDIQGAEQLRAKHRNGCYIFILPPSIEVLLSRLKNRGSDSESEIKLRFGKATEEIRHYKNYDHIIINRDLEEAAQKLRAIITSERCRYPNFIPVLPDLEL